MSRTNSSDSPYATRGRYADSYQPKIKEIQIQLTGFLNKETPAFCKELWDLMLSAQDSPVGVPRELLEAKKLELQQEQVRDGERATGNAWLTRHKVI